MGGERAEGTELVGWVAATVGWVVGAEAHWEVVRAVRAAVARVEVEEVAVMETEREAA